MKRLFPTLLLLATAAGCQLVPTERKSSGSTATAGAMAATNSLVVKRAIEGRLPPEPPTLTTTVSGMSNSVTMNLPPGYWQPSGGAGLSRYGGKVEPYRETEEILSNSSQAAQETTSTTKSSAVTIPLGVTLALAGVGILILVGAITYALKAIRNSSATARLVMDTADEMAAAKIRTLRERIRIAQETAAAAIDPARIAVEVADTAHAHSEIAELEAQRGKLKSLKLK